jgi:hypothetical protein
MRLYSIDSDCLFVSRIVAVMRPLIGTMDMGDVQRIGYSAAGEIYDQLLPDWQLGNGVPNPDLVMRWQAVSEAFSLAYKQLGSRRSAQDCIDALKRRVQLQNNRHLG